MGKIISEDATSDCGKYESEIVKIRNRMAEILEGYGPDADELMRLSYALYMLECANSRNCAKLFGLI